MNKLQHRRKQYEIMATHLSQLSDEQLKSILASAKPIAAGLGGKAALIEITKIPVFVKKVSLTRLEKLPQHFMSTANLYDLPLCYQYGIGAAGFHPWRELAVHIMTTEWVLKGECAYFPLLYHWRMLNRDHQEANIQFHADLEKYRQDVLYFDKVSKRVEDLHQATTDIVFFVEYIPQHLYDWLSGEILKGAEQGSAAVAWVGESLRNINNDLNARGLLHFDEHYENILIDDGQIYLTDFGLSLFSAFELTVAETTFFKEHKSYDPVCAIVNLLHCIVTTFLGRENWELHLRDVIAHGSEVIPARICATLKRYAPVAIALDSFFQKLNKEDKFASYPVMQLERLLETLS